MSRAVLSAFVLSGLLGAAALSGCDAHDAEASQPVPFQIVRTATGVTLDAPIPQAASGDVLFHLDALPADAVVSAELKTSAGDPRLEYAATDGDIRLVAEGARTVEVAYLADGREVAPRAELTGTEGGVYSAGSSATGPTSYHYVRDRDGAISIRWDYNNDGGRRADPAAPRGATIQTAAGETVHVTDVAFRAWGLDLGTIESVEIQSPSTLHIAEALVRQ